jgi:ribosomal protein S18 acetylase RimI-like enzyme
MRITLIACIYRWHSSSKMTHNDEILALAKTLFISAEWSYIESALETSLPEFSKTIRCDNKIVAFVIVNSHASGSAYISYCGVDPKYQGKGYGSKLLKETLSSIFQADFPFIFLYVDCWNKDARRLYERFGFKQICSEVVAGSYCWKMELRQTG